MLCWNCAYLSFCFADCLNDVFVLISQVLWLICFSAEERIGYQRFKQLHALSSECRYSSVEGTNTGAHSISQLKGPSGCFCVLLFFLLLSVFLFSTFCSLVFGFNIVT